MYEAAVLETINTWGYAGIFGGMLLEGLTVPFPGTIFVLLAGALAVKLKLNLWYIVVSAVLGYTLGTFLPYYVAKRGGREVLFKYGKYIRLTPQTLELAEDWFARYGNWVVCFSRPFFFGNYISYLAGLGKMRLRTFLLYTILGVLPWSIILSAMGYYSGQAGWAIVQNYGKYAVVIVPTLLAALFGLKLLLTRSGLWQKINLQLLGRKGGGR